MRVERVEERRARVDRIRAFCENVAEQVRTGSLNGDSLRKVIGELADTDRRIAYAEFGKAWLEGLP